MAAGLNPKQKYRIAFKVLQRVKAARPGASYKRGVVTLDNGVQISVAWSNMSNGASVAALKAVNPANSKIAQRYSFEQGKLSDLVAEVL